MLTWKEIWLYIHLFFRWAPLWIMAVALSCGTAWYISRRQPDYYVARATLMVGTNFAVAAPDRYAVDLSNVLANYYATLVRREKILQPAVDSLKLSFPWQIVAGRMLSTGIDTQANLLELMITDTDPERAAALANAVAEQLVRYTPSAEEDVAQQRAEIDRQIQQTQQTLQEIERKIAELEQRQANLDSAIDLRDIQDQLKSLQAARDRYQQNYNSQVVLRNNSSVNSLQIFEQATPPMVPLARKQELTIAIAGAGGMALAIVAIILIDQIDDRWRSGGDLRSRMHMAWLGTIRYGRLAAASEIGPDGASQRRAIHSIHTAVVLAAKQGAPRVLLVTSPQPGDARSTLSIDLAAAYARSGHRVLLVAAEQMRPGVPWPLREIGQGAARAEANSAEILQQLISSTAERAASASLTDSIRPTDLPNLQLLPFVASEQGQSRYLIPWIYWPKMVMDLRAIADIVVFDGPSAMTGPEAALLAPLADGVVLALNPKTDNRAQIMAATARLGWHPDASLLGAVIVESGSTAAPQAVARAAQRLRLPKVAVTASGLVITLPTRADPAPGAAWPVPTGHSSQD